MSEPTKNEEWVDEITDAVISEVQRTGYFDKVQGHEPKRKPTPRTGLWAAVWMQRLVPIGQISGQANTSGVLVFNIRIYANMLQEPQDAIDPKLTRAASNIMRNFHDDFDFGGLIRNVDLLGSTGVAALNAQAGYVEQDNTMFRIYDITVPCIVNDIWPQIHS